MCGCEGASSDACPSGSSSYARTGGDGVVEAWCKTDAGVANGPYTKRASAGGPLLAEGGFAEGDADGAWTEWTKVVDTSTHYVKTLEAHYSHGLPNGLFRTFALPSGKLASESSFKGGVACGLWQEFDELGAVTSQMQLAECSKVASIDAPPVLPTDPLLGAPKTTDFGWSGKSCPGGAKPSTSTADLLERFCVVGGVREGDYGRFIVSPTGERKVDAGQYAAGKRTGAWRSWYANGVLSATGSFVGDLRSGEWRHYYADGWLADRTAYTDGLRDGVASTYHDGGVLGAETTWKKGALDGPAKTWKSNGELDSVGAYAGNLRQGKWAYYGHNLGALVRTEGMVEAGYAQGIWKGTYDASGNKEAESIYSDNEINGVYLQWHENGQEASSGRYVANLRNGPWLFHHDNGQLWISANYLFGELFGDFEEFYPDGKPKTKGTFNAWATWTFWDENGVVTSCNAPSASVYMECP